ncbi:hypothetical protein FQ087_12055 [Sporosarcina sp. ANT_H38]|uniref:hypothetical protein n=1 Tax=Sporosarcina sp. ANT_H38 TaxID=2597358 RepID=UPI0011F0CBF0|nr:hypothetical protein [Sporosarcina sp. ANT_H38]KAA0966911.1 hypothetical protein FQ087_12055 [Sporosarcina sp. ANT_H38]
MQKWIPRMGMLLLTLIATGCSPDKDQIPEGKTDPVENLTPTSETVSESAWEGDWIFLSDTILGTLHITDNDETEFNYKMSGSQPTTENASPVSLTYEGTGKIVGNTAQATCEPIADCKMTIEMNGSMLKLTISNEITDGSELKLSGEYKKSTSIGQAPMFQMKNDQFQIYGILQGDNPSEVKSTLGNPESEGPDELMHTGWNQQYPAKELVVTYYDDWVETISITTTKDALESEIAEHFEGERYRNKDGTEYLLVPKNESLLFYRPNEDDPTKINVLVTVADENFYYNLELGEISKVE